MIIYVMGRGYSGSTILDISLSQSDNVCGLGELISGLGKKKLCACGQFTKDCEKWKHLHSGSKKVANEDLRYVKKQSNIIHFAKYLFCTKKVFLKKAHKYLTVNRSIISARKADDTCSVLVDSSKELTRALILSRSDDEVVLVHLVKNPINVISSYLKRVESGEGFRFLRKKYNNKSARFLSLFISSCGWVVGNLLCELIKYRTQKRVITIRYEDLSNSPVGIINELETATKIDFKNTKDFLKGKMSAKNLHQVGGNKVKREETICFVKSKANRERNRLNVLEKIIALPPIFLLKKYYRY